VRVGGSTLKKSIIREGYHCYQCEESNPMGWVPNKGVDEGGCKKKKDHKRGLLL
jgi:hypothetical protein